jgi:hypothetical protein
MLNLLLFVCFRPEIDFCSMPKVAPCEFHSTHHWLNGLVIWYVFASSSSLIVRLRNRRLTHDRRVNVHQLQHARQEPYVHVGITP